MRIKIGSLVMWNIKNSQDYGCMGVVKSMQTDVDRCVFVVLWADGSLTDYSIGNININNIKVVNF